MRSKEKEYHVIEEDCMLLKHIWLRFCFLLICGIENSNTFELHFSKLYMIQHNWEAGAQNMKSNLITTYLKMMKMLENTYLLPKT